MCCPCIPLLKSTAGFRQREYHEASLTAFQAYKHFYTDQVVPLLAEQKDVEAALQKMEPKAAQDAEVQQPPCLHWLLSTAGIAAAYLVAARPCLWAHTSFCFLTHAQPRF